MQKTNKKTFAALWIVFMFQGMAGGFWIPALTNLLNAEGYGTWVPIAFATLPICALISPLFVGTLADERFSAQRLFGWCSLLSSILLALAFSTLDFGLPPGFFIAGLAAFGLIGGPAWGLLTNVGLTNLPYPERQFPWVRVGATFGWVGAGVITSFALQADAKPTSGYAAACALICAGSIGFFLPDTPPLSSRGNWWQSLGLGAFRLFKNRNHAVLFCTTGLFSIPLAAFYMYAPELLKALGDKSPTASMSIAQGTELLAMIFLGYLMVKFRLKTLLIVGLAFSALRFGMSGYAGYSGVIGWHLGGIALHGFCYTFYFITAQVYMNRRVDPGMRGQAQGLLSLMTSGIGPLVGAFFCGWLRNTLVDETGQGWENFWWVLSAIITACWLGFGLLYQGKKAGE